MNLGGKSAEDILIDLKVDGELLLCEAAYHIPPITLPLPARPYENKNGKLKTPIWYVIRSGEASTKLAPRIRERVMKERREIGIVYWYQKGRGDSPTDSWSLECVELRHKAAPAIVMPWIKILKKRETSSGILITKVNVANYPIPSENNLPIRIHYGIGDTFAEAKKILKQQS
jgi:hypothetical protein